MSLWDIYMAQLGRHLLGTIQDSPVGTNPSFLCVPAINSKGKQPLPKNPN